MTDFSDMMDICRIETPKIESVNGKKNVDVSPVVHRMIRINKGVPPVSYGASVPY